MLRSHHLLFFLLSITLLMTPSISTYAQKAERKNIRKGNNVYKKEKYTEAEIAYLKALEVNPKSLIATYNLGNALFKQKKTQQALEKYQLAYSQEKDPNKKAAITHNAANAYMDLNDYNNAVSFYKESLRLNPTDDETRYNLAVAQALLKKQQQQKKKDKNKDNKDKNKDKQDQKQQQQQQQQDDQKKQQQKQQQQQQQNKQEQVSKEKAQQLLDALMQDEKETQDKVKKLQLQQSRSKKTEKDR